MSSSTSTLAYDIIARDKASSTFSKIGRAAGALGIGLGTIQLANFVKDSVNVEAVFSQTMASIQVNAGIGEKALGSLSDLAVKLGQDTVYSANEAAQAMLELSKGGMTAAQIKAGALKSTLNLAATEGIGLSDSATIVARTLKTFGMTAGDANTAVDMLAGGSLASTAGVQDLADALKYVGSTAKSSGYNLSDTVTALSELTDSGLASTTAGTALNRMMLGLTLGTNRAQEAADDLGLSFTDVKGNLIPLQDVVKKLQDRFEGMGTAARNNELKKIFGVEGMRAANILIEGGVKGWGKYKGAVDKAGQAAKMADARMSGTKGSLERLDGAVETAQLKLGKALAPAVQNVADTLSENLGPAMDGTIDLAGSVVDAVQPVFSLMKTGAGVVGDLGGALNGLPSEVKTLAIEAALAAAVFPKLSSGIGSASSAMRNGITYTRVLAAEFRDVETRGTATTAVMGKLGGAAKAAAGVGGMLMLVDGAKQTNDALGTMESVAGGALTGFAAGGPWGAAIGAGAGLLAGLAGAIKGAGDEASDAKPNFQGLADSLDQVTGATTRATRAQIYNDLEQSGALKTLNAYGISSRTAVDAVLGHAHALHTVQAATIAANQEYDANTAAIARNNTEIEGLISSGASATDAGRARVFELQNENIAMERQNDAIKDGRKAVDGEIGALRKSQRAVKEKAAAVESLRKLYKGMPKDVVTEMKQHGVPETVGDVKKLMRQFDLVPKDVQTLLKQVGVDKSIDEIKRMIAQQDRLHDKQVHYTVTTQYRYSGVDPTRGRGDDTAPSGKSAVSPRRSSSRTSGRYSSKSNPDLVVEVKGLDHGQKAYVRGGGRTRYS